MLVALEGRHGTDRWKQNSQDFLRHPKAQKRVCDKEKKSSYHDLVVHGTTTKTTKQNKTEINQAREVGEVGQRDGSALKKAQVGFQQPHGGLCVTLVSGNLKDSEVLFWSSQVTDTPKMNIHI